jgi:hypothetical protein
MRQVELLFSGVYVVCFLLVENDTVPYCFDAHDLIKILSGTVNAASPKLDSICQVTPNFPPVTSSKQTVYW